MTTSRLFHQWYLDLRWIRQCLVEHDAVDLDHWPLIRWMGLRILPEREEVTCVEAIEGEGCSASVTELRK